MAINWDQEGREKMQKEKSSKDKMEIKSSTQTELSDSLSKLSLINLLNEYEKLEGEVVEVRDLRDMKEYKAEDIIGKILDLAKGHIKSDLSVSDKMVDKDGNIISISLKGKSEKNNGCYCKLTFCINCSYGEKSGSNETVIMEEYYDDADFSEIFDAETVYKF